MQCISVYLAYIWGFRANDVQYRRPPALMTAGQLNHDQRPLQLLRENFELKIISQYEPRTSLLASRQSLYELRAVARVLKRGFDQIFSVGAFSIPAKSS